MDSIILTDNDLDILLNPYIDKKELKDVWKKFLLDKGLENNHKDIQKLSLKIVKENKISPVIIKSLFNTNKIICEEKLNEWVLTKIYTIPTDKELDFFEDSEGVVNDIKKRIRYPPNTDISRVGPINSDHDATEWCHLCDEYNEHEKVFHGMITCECHDNLPDKLCDLKCDMCEKSIDINDLVRFPYVNDEGDGGWEGTYCSYDCLQTNCFIYDVKEKIICAIYFDN